MAVTRAIFVGPPEAGKSTLKHLLVHNTPKAVKTSTAVMETPEVVSFSAEQYVVGETTSAWQLVNSTVMRKALHACIENKRYEKKDQFPAEMEAKETEDGQHESSVEEQMDGTPLPKRLNTKQHESDMALLDKQHTKLREGMGGEGKHFELKDASFIHLLDTGGQQSFQDVLPLLLDVPCTYIQVFNAARSLDEPVPITYRPDERTRVPLEDEELGREMMLRSFSSMQTMAQKCSKRLASFLQEGSPVPQLCIFVVGTHKDQLIEEKRLDKATDDVTNFMKGLQGKPYYNSIKWDSGQPFFLIDAMGGKDDRASINRLRELLSSEGSPLKLDVPVMWFTFQEITRYTPKKFFSLLDLEAFCQKHGFIDGENAASQFRALLQLFSLLGFYSFFKVKGVLDKDNFVCTDTGVFLKEVSKLLAVQFLKPSSPGMATFKQTGILVFTEKLFQELEISQEMDPHWFLGALQHLGIAARMPSKDQVEYFIPAALPQKSATPDLQATVDPLCLTYTTRYGSFSFSEMPRGVFCRLAVELSQQGWDIVKDESSRSLLKYQVDDFTIFLKECPGYISVIPQAVAKFCSLSELHTTCKSLISTVTQCLSDSTKDVLGSQFSSNANLAIGFTCNCKEKMVPHLAIRAPSKQGIRFKCTRKHGLLTSSSRHLIWFSPVNNVEVSICKRY